MASGGARITIRHVSGALLMGGGDEPDAGRGEEVEGIHIGGADDAEDVLHAIGDERLDESFGCGHDRHG